jgi:hypothetical protein
MKERLTTQAELRIRYQTRGNEYERSYASRILSGFRLSLETAETHPHFR